MKICQKLQIIIQQNMKDINNLNKSVLLINFLIIPKATKKFGNPVEK